MLGCGWPVGPAVGAVVGATVGTAVGWVVPVGAGPLVGAVVGAVVGVALGVTNGGVTGHCGIPKPVILVIKSTKSTGILLADPTLSLINSHWALRVRDRRMISSYCSLLASLTMCMIRLPLATLFSQAPLGTL